MSEPLISVLMPVLNAEHYIESAVCSILSQTYTDFELIVLDDGSTDQTLSLLARLKGQDQRIRLYSRENKGLVATLNEGLLLAKGEWIARMDADDIALPERFAKQMQQLQTTGADLCGSWVQHFGSSDKRIIQYAESHAAILMELLFNPAFAHPTIIMRAKILKQLGYQSGWQGAEDYELWTRAAQAGLQMTNVLEVLLNYRQHDRQISTASSLQQQQLTQQIRQRYWLFMFKSMQLNASLIPDVLALREQAVTNINMDKVDLAIDSVLRNTQDEARKCFFKHATRLYFRAASNCPDIVRRWGGLNAQYGSGRGIGTKIKLWLLQRFNIHPQSRMFTRLKKSYFSLLRSF